MRTIKCIVAATNANGEPDLYPVKIHCAEDQIETGFHYDAARDSAQRMGYEATIGTLVYDEDCRAGRAMLPLFKWKTASLITI